MPFNGSDPLRGKAVAQLDVVATGPRIVRSAAGFSLVDMICVVAVFAILAGISVPAFQNVSEGYKLGQTVREVERELQTARLKAVTANRPLRIRFDCPAAGQYRITELIGTSSVPAAEDSAAIAPCRVPRLGSRCGRRHIGS